MSSKILISNLPQIQRSINELFESVKEKIQQSSSAVIQIDLSYPQPHPTTINPEVLKAVIQHLVSFGIEQISVVGESDYSISSHKIWDALGFPEYITSQFSQVQFISQDDSTLEKTTHELTYRNVTFPKIVEDAELFISIINPKVSFLNKLDLAIENTQHLLTSADRVIFKEDGEDDFCENDLYKKKYTQNMVETYFLRPPDLILYDLTSILSCAGPTIYRDSKLIHSDLFMLTEDGVLGDIVALTLCGLQPDGDKTVEAIKNYDYKLVSKEIIEKQEISLIVDEEGESTEKDISFLLNNRDSDQKQRFWKKKEEKIKENLPLIQGFDSFLDILDIFPQKVEICKGVACSGCKHAVNELLLFLKTSMVKDRETIPEFSMLLGKNPIEPKNGYCIVFGDCAIESTKERNFRQRIITRSSRSDIDFELERAKLKIKYQKKLVELESHTDFIKQEIPEGKKRDNALKRLDRRLKQAKRLSEIRIKIQEWHLEHLQKRNNRLKEYSKEIPNDNVLEIQGCPPKLLVNLKSIIKLFGKRWVPGLVFRYEFIEKFVQRESKEKETVE